jgi:hypothetical protein
MTINQHALSRSLAMPGLVGLLALVGCTGSADPVARAEAQVSASERAVGEADAAFTAASEQFCQASEDYIGALDRYGDVLHSTTPTVGDVRTAGADLAEPEQGAISAADGAVEAHEESIAAQDDLADAQAALLSARSPSQEPVATQTPGPSPSPLAPRASVERVERAQSDFDAAQSSISDDTDLRDASERFNSAVVALELAWLGLLADTGCLTNEQAEQADAAVRAYTTALQQDLTIAGFYVGAVDGIYGPLTVEAVEALQQSAGLPVTGTVDKATAEALESSLDAVGDDATQETIASTAAAQQTLALAGYWDGPVDGEWTPELTESLKTLQMDLGIPPTGEVDAATISALNAALAELAGENVGASPAPTPTTDP